MNVNPSSSTPGNNPDIPPLGDVAAEPPPPAASPRQVPPGMPGPAERRKAGPAEGSAADRPRQPPPASSSQGAQATRPVITDKWPYGQALMGSYLKAGNSDALLRDPTLKTSGRALPPLTPQAIGCDFSEPVGQWPRADREKLAPAVTKNLNLLGTLGEGRERNQLHMEITTMWLALCEAEKGDVLNSLGTEQAALLGDTTRAASQDLPRTPVRDWLDHMAVNMKPEQAARLLGSCTPEAEQALTAPMQVVDAEPRLKALLDDRFADVSASMPVDHQVDYRGFLERTNRVVGELPEGEKDISIGIVGGGPAGIMAADLANRAGIKNIEVLEQAGQIGGRIAAKHWEGISTPFHPGGMRFHRDRNNAYWGLAEHYGLEFEPFPNPGSPGVPITYLLGGKVATVQPGQQADDPVMRKVAHDIQRAMIDPFFKPIDEARKAGDTAEVRRLWDKAKKDFDSHSFRSGVDQLLAEQGIEWTEEEWQTFGAVGIGVGGYKGYSDIGFLEEARFVSDGRLKDHVGLKEGADAPLYKLVADREGLPEGVGSLEDKQVIKLNTEVTEIRKVDGKYRVSVLDKTTGKTDEKVYDELLFSGSPREALRLGLHAPAPGTEPMLPDEFVAALKNANLVSATKAGFGIAVGSIRADELPANIQTDEFYQQVYMMLQPDGTGAVYSEYAQGKNADKAVGMTVEDRRDGFIKLLRSVASREPDNPEYQKIGKLADLVEANRDRFFYTNWAEERHVWAAFKMDAPGDLENSRRLYGFLTERHDDGVIPMGEKLTYEGGFASGAIASAILATQKLVVRHGGTLPVNSPLHQELL
ncbi:flavin monoamine oxidase family protein [Paraburkholderia terricola]|uniref:Tryptophan 2-monooxygenase n=1 Tax=Paraburkholderia terricola TaxID=169427 RepID=A0ABU1LRJ6_9BURK|nr:FAD-dependent oxidoreductase [Paraburkholderia terricola]MDR6409160.1 monoamine oxidase [Paraburkholderia terricola]MDR6482577.1 monoamine oxidase [Paraburkholderia terricola]